MDLLTYCDDALGVTNFKDIRGRMLVKYKIKVDYNRDAYLSEFSKKTLQDRYLIDGEISSHAFARAASAFANDQEHAQRLYDYASKLWFMFSTPILSNGGTTVDFQLAVSNYVDDSREGITNHYIENAFLSSVGGGVGGAWNGVRSVGSKTSNGSESTGVIPFLKVVDAEMLAFSQVLRVVVAMQHIYQ